MPEKSAPTPPDTIPIVRYPNRRLYDRSQGRYITLVEIADLVRAGKMIRVVDSKTNEDLTSTLLTQIILEHCPERMDLLPLPVLHMMIRTNGVVLGLLREYFRQSQTYLDFWQRAADFNPLASSAAWLKSLLPTASTITPGPEDNARGEKAARDEILDTATLAQRLADMERRLNALQGNTGPGPATPDEKRRADSEKPRRRRGESR